MIATTTTTITAYCIPTTYDPLWNPSTDKYTVDAAKIINLLEELKEERYAFILLEYNGELTIGYGLDCDPEGWGDEYEQFTISDVKYWKKFIS
jgi:hypothetical protein